MKTANSFLATFRITVALCVVFSVVLLRTEVAVAQCPSDIAPLDVLWGGPFSASMIMPGTTCTINYDFCLRVVDGVTQMYLEDLQPQSPDCDNISYLDMTNAVVDDLFKAVIADPCGPGNIRTTSTAIRGSCVSFTQSAGGAPICNFCGGAYCLKTCEVCTVAGQNQLFNCTTTALNTPDCQPVADWSQITPHLSTTWWGQFSSS